MLFRFSVPPLHFIASTADDALNALYLFQFFFFCFSSFYQSNFTFFVYYLLQTAVYFIWFFLSLVWKCFRSVVPVSNMELDINRIDSMDTYYGIFVIHNLGTLLRYGRSFILFHFSFFFLVFNSSPFSSSRFVFPFPFPFLRKFGFRFV